MGILRTDRVSGLGGANAIKGSVFFGNCLSSASVLGNDYLITERSSNFTFGTGDITIEGWFFCTRLSSSTGYQSLVGDTVYYNGDASINGFTFYIENEQLNFWSDVSDSVVSGGTIVQNEWTHLAYTRESGSNKIFVNGSLVGTASDSTDYTDTALTIGTNKVTQTSGSDAGQFSFNGFASNVRVLKGRALYTAAFTPPVGELEVIDNTVLLCCQSPGNVLQEATGVILNAPKINNSAGAQASHFTPNSPVGFSTTTDVGTQFGSTFDGVTTFDSQAYFVPPGGNTRERNRGRGVIRGGMTPNSSALTKIAQYIEMSSGGNTIDFGDGTTASYGGAGLASATRGVYNLGATTNTSPFSIVNTLEFITIANTSNATDFGDLVVQRQNTAPMSNQTRGIWAAGLSPANKVNMDFITIATLGNAQDFGDSIGGSYGINQGGQAGSSTRGLIAGGNSNSAPAEVEKIQFVTFASLGDAQDFGDLVDQNGYSNVGASSGTRALFAGGGNVGSPFVTVNTIQFVTIATTGNATDFGDLTESRYGGGGLSNGTRGCFIGGVNYPNVVRHNIIDFVTIATTGNASDFGDIAVVNVNSVGTMSDSHGGL